MGKLTKKGSQNPAQMSTPKHGPNIGAFFKANDSPCIERDAACEGGPRVPAEMDASPPRRGDMREDSERRSDAGRADVEDLRRCLESLPTRTEMEALFKRLEETRAQDMKVFQEGLYGLNQRLEEVEASNTEIVEAIVQLQETVSSQHMAMQTMQYQLDDQEDRQRRNNIRLKGIPETIGVPELKQTVLAIFNVLLENSNTQQIELDRIHRIPNHRKPEAQYPRDVICRVHFYKQKEEIMNKARDRGIIDFDGAKISCYSDLSSRTLARRRALKPLTKVLQEAAIVYRWGYPFQLIAHKEGKAYIFRTPKDLPDFLAALQLSPVQLDEWTDCCPPVWKQAQNKEKWQKVPASKKQRRNHRTLS